MLLEPLIDHEFGLLHRIFAHSLYMSLSSGSAGEIERAATAFARASNGGLIVTPVTLTIVHRDLIITLAARHRLPAVYGLRPFVTSGGLISYALIRSTR